MPPVFQLRQQTFSEGEGSLRGSFCKYTGVVAECHYPRNLGVHLDRDCNPLVDFPRPVAASLAARGGHSMRSKYRRHRRQAHEQLRCPHLRYALAGSRSGDLMTFSLV